MEGGGEVQVGGWEDGFVAFLYNRGDVEDQDVVPRYHILVFLLFLCLIGDRDVVNTSNECIGWRAVLLRLMSLYTDLALVLFCLTKQTLQT